MQIQFIETQPKDRNSLNILTELLNNQQATSILLNNTKTFIQDRGFLAKDIFSHYL